MRVMNLMIVLAVIAVVVLVAQYISQLRHGRSGNYYVSGGRVFLNWVLAIVLVICLVGIGYEGFYGNKQEAKPTQTSKSENVKYTSSDEADEEVTVQFDKKVELDENGEAKVKFTISPQTKLTIREHKSKTIDKVFKANGKTKHTYTFDAAGTYDIIAQRGSQKVTKQLKVKGITSESSSSSVPVSSSSSVVQSSSSSAASSSTSATAQSSNSSRSAAGGAQTAPSNGTGRSYIQRRPNAPAQNNGGSAIDSRPSAPNNTENETNGQAIY